MHALTTDHIISRRASHCCNALRRLTGVSVAMLSAIFLVVAVSVWGSVGVAVGAGCVLAAWAASVDVCETRLPNRLVGAAGIPMLVIVAASLLSGGFGAAGDVVGRVAAGSALVAVPLLVLHLVSPDGLGFGDVKLGTVLGANLGLIDPRLGMVALCLASGGTAAVALLTGRRAIPFGPGLVLGTTCAFLLAGLIGSEAVSW